MSIAYRFVVLAGLSLSLACGSVSPIGATGGGGSNGDGGAGTSGSAGTSGAAGTTAAAGTSGAGGSTNAAGTTGSAGTTGAAGTQGTAGTSGAAGTGGRVPVKHRAAATACSPGRPPGICQAASNPSTPPASLLCKADADCAAGQNGRCLNMPRGIGCQCTYDACFQDSDCPQAGGPCECRAATSSSVPGYTTTNVCKGGNCRTDKDCGAGGYCSPSFGSCGAFLGVIAYYCHTPKDKCVDDGDCAAQGGGDCRFNQVMGLWMCETSACAG